MDISDKHVGFIGAGNMAKAIASGIIKKGLVPAAHVHASAPSDTNLKEWAGWGAVTTNHNWEIISSCHVVFLAVKPHLLERALARGSDAEISEEQRHSIEKGDKLFVSVVSGLTMGRLAQILKRQLNLSNAYVIRSIPSTPCLVGEGTTAYAVPSDRPEIPQHSALVERVFSSVGLCKKMEERYIDVVTGSFGSGTAFVLTMIDAMASGAVKMGMPWTAAREFAAQAVLGSGKLVLETGKHPCQLRDEVSSPGGTTIAGLHVLESSGFRSGVMSAIETAVNKAIELGKSN